MQADIAKLMAKLRIPWFPLVEKHCCPQQPTDLLLNPCCLNIQYTENRQKEKTTSVQDGLCSAYNVWRKNKAIFGLV